MTPLGGGTPPSANTPPPADGPNVQVPPVLQVHVVPEQLQSPEQAAEKVEGLPPQLRGRVTPRTTIHVAPKHSEETDCDTFTPWVVRAGRVPGSPIAWRSGFNDKQPACLPEQGSHDRLDAVEDSLDLGHRAEADVGPGERCDNDGRRKDEAHAPEDQPEPAALLVTDEDRQLRRAGAGDEIRRAEQVQEPLGREPSASPDNLVLHDGDVSRRASECREAESKKEEGKLGELRARPGASRSFVSHRDPAVPTCAHPETVVRLPPGEGRRSREASSSRYGPRGPSPRSRSW